MIPEADAELHKEIRDVTLLGGKSHTSTLLATVDLKESGREM